jgi:Fe-S-cluster containining protein
MGYPAFILPREPMTEQQISENPELVAKIAKDPRLKQDLLDGHPGETHWHNLPEELRSELESFVSDYQTPNYNEDPSSFDQACCWLDMETRQCKNHLHRPQVCRDFETGSRECLEWRSFYQDKIVEPI